MIDVNVWEHAFERRRDQLLKFREELESAHRNSLSQIDCLLCIEGGAKAPLSGVAAEMRPQWAGCVRGWAERVVGRITWAATPLDFHPLPIKGAYAGFFLLGTSVEPAELPRAVRPFDMLAKVASEHLGGISGFEGLNSIYGPAGWLWLCYVLGWKAVQGLGYRVLASYLTPGQDWPPFELAIYSGGPDTLVVSYGY